MRTTARDRAGRLLTEGRVSIVKVDGRSLLALVRGEGHLYRVTYQAGAWDCPCEARTTCSHLYAVKRVVAVDIEGTHP